MLFTLHWYILREMGKTFVLTALGLTAVLGLGGGVMNLIDLEQVSPAQLLQIMAIVLPVAGTLTLPIAALYSATMTYSRLSADNELLACKSSGINIHRLMLAPLVISLISASCTFYFINFMVPGFVRRLDRFVQTDIRQFVEQRVNSPERLTLPGGNVRIYADGLSPSAADEDTVTLTGVAFLDMGPETWKRYGLCESIAVRFAVEDGQPTIAASLYHAIYYDRKRNEWTEIEHQQIAPNKILRRVRQRVKWLDLGALVRYRIEPHRWPKVARQVAALRSAVCSERFYADVLERFRGAQGRITLHDSTGAVYLQVRSATSDAFDGRLTFTDPTVTHRRAGQTRIIRGDSASLLVRPPNADGVQYAVLDITGNVRIDEGRGGPNLLHTGRERIGGLVLPEHIVDEIRALGDAEFLDRQNAMTLRQATGERLEAAREASSKFVREIRSELHSRTTLSLTVFVLVILGAALGIVFRAGHALEAFGISFVPSLIVIVMNITGRQLAEKTSTADLGVALMWIAIGAVALLDVFLLTRVVRR